MAEPLGGGALAPLLFLSYSRADTAAVRRVYEALKARGVPIFFDAESLPLGLPWQSRVEGALARSSAIAVCLGPTGLGDTQRDEVDLAVALQKAQGKAGRVLPVIPVVLKDANPEAAATFLFNRTWLDLRNELEEPARIEALAKAVLGEPAALERVGSAEPLCPYRGLRAFTQEDEPVYCGRHRFAGPLFDLTLQRPFVAVVAPSGNGKSSLVQAGLLPKLRRQRPPDATWVTAVFTPGKSPFVSLAQALAALIEPDLSPLDRIARAGKFGSELRDGSAPIDLAVKAALDASRGAGRLALVVDQLEELFTLAPEAERAPFVKLLLAAVKSERCTVIATLRADFYGQAMAASDELCDLLQRGILNLGTMRQGELRDAIAMPAERVGLRLQDGLLDRILADLGDAPGSLPLLEYALTQLWEKRAGQELTHAAYDEIGGVTGAIGTRAEQVFEALTEDEQAAALRFFGRLVRVAAGGEEGSDSRHRARLADLRDDERAVLRRFADARLVTTDRDPQTNDETAEVAHEAILKSWKRLAERIDENRAFLLWRQRLGVRLAEWRRAPADEGSILRGAQLREAKEWLQKRQLEVNEEETKYLRVSAKRDQRARWVGRALILLLALGLTGYAGYSAFGIYVTWLQADLAKVSRIVFGAPVEEGSAAARLFWLAALAASGQAEAALDRAYSLPVGEQSQVGAALAQAFAANGDEVHALAALKVVVSGDMKLNARQMLGAIGRTAELLSRRHPGTYDFAATFTDLLAKSRRWTTLAMAVGYRRAGSSGPAQEAFAGFLSSLEDVKSDPAAALRDAVVAAEILYEGGDGDLALETVAIGVKLASRRDTEGRSYSELRLFGPNPPGLLALPALFPVAGSGASVRGPPPFAQRVGAALAREGGGIDAMSRFGAVANMLSASSIGGLMAGLVGEGDRSGEMAIEGLVKLPSAECLGLLAASFLLERGLPLQAGRMLKQASGAAERSKLGPEEHLASLDALAGRCTHVLGDGGRAGRLEQAQLIAIEYARQGAYRDLAEVVKRPTANTALRVYAAATLIRRHPQAELPLAELAMTFSRALVKDEAPPLAASDLTSALIGAHRLAEARLLIEAITLEGIQRPILIEALNVLLAQDEASAERWVASFSNSRVASAGQAHCARWSANHGECDEAKSALAKWVSASDRSTAGVAMADCYAKAGKLAEAEQAIRRCSNPDDRLTASAKVLLRYSKTPAAAALLAENP